MVRDKDEDEDEYEPMLAWQEAGVQVGYKRIVQGHGNQAEGEAEQTEGTADSGQQTSSKRDMTMGWRCVWVILWVGKVQQRVAVRALGHGSKFQVYPSLAVDASTTHPHGHTACQLAV